jgi:hypothetical protein
VYQAYPSSLSIPRAATLATFINSNAAGTRFRTLDDGFGNWTLQSGSSTTSTPWAGDAWGSDANEDDHFGFSIGFTLSGSDSSPDTLMEVAFEKSKLDIDDEAEVTVAFFYRAVNANDITLETASTSYADGTEYSSGYGAGVGPGGTTTQTYLAGSGEIRVMEHTRTGSAFWNNASDDIIGVGVIVPSSPTDAPVSGNHLEFLGHVVFQSKDGVGGVKILDASVGLIDLLVGRSGFDPTEHLAGISSAAQTALIDYIAQIRGDGSTPASKPIDVVATMMAHNDDLATAHVAGLVNLKSRYAGIFTAGSYTAPDYLWINPWQIGTDGAQPTRDKVDAVDAAVNGGDLDGDALISLYWHYRGEIPDDLDPAALDPFGTAYGTFVLDAGRVHPTSADNDTAEAIVFDYYSHYANVDAVLQVAPAAVTAPPKKVGRRARMRRGGERAARVAPKGRRRR